MRWLVERSGGLDVVALQDGFGPERHLAAHMTIERLPAWLMATRRGIGRAELWANIETYRQVAGGWPFIASGLKTLLETGAPMMAEQG